VEMGREREDRYGLVAGVSASKQGGKRECKPRILEYLVTGMGGSHALTHVKTANAQVDMIASVSNVVTRMHKHREPTLNK
jgi:hypothetical protein